MQGTMLTIRMMFKGKWKRKIVKLALNTIEKSALNKLRTRWNSSGIYFQYVYQNTVSSYYYC